jgi:alcohol dehydrogenase
VLDALRPVRHQELLDIARMFSIADADGALAVQQLPQMIRELVAQLGIPTTLKAFGIDERQLPALTADALGVTRLARAFPVKKVADAYERIVRHAWHGTFETSENKEIEYH